ncbi:hypothetical protein [Mangrovimonas xylaniphaga]|uniref:hypothetical protein n=1 Tax=Mangrovimonas xylaniphaga TaxID=1645915 RepID=UPI0006B41115|nr:hypothetical protein [Mangrovimonas xylaniphaga]
MTHTEIIIQDATSINNKLVDAIIKKAQRLSLDSEIINRRMLVDYLNEELQVNLKEGLYIKQLLKEAYLKSSYSSSIQNAIVNNILDNDGKNRVFNPSRVEQRVEALNIQNPQIDLNDFNLIAQETETVKKVDGTFEIQTIQKKIDSLKPKKEISITGSSKVEAIREHAFNIKEEYTKIIQTHEKVKDINLNLVDDFDKTRNKLKLIREDLLALLIDLFGDNIKASEPELFDVSKINWESFEDRYGKLDTYFSCINDNVAIFREAHQQHLSAMALSGKNEFNKFLSKTSKLANAGKLNNSNLKGAAGAAAVGFLIEGGAAVLKSRSQAKKTIAQIELDIEKMKEGMRSDVQLILDDILKLGRFYTELKDKLIPQLKLFSQKAINKLADDISPLYEQIISNQEIRDLRDSNKKLLTEFRVIEAELIDKNEQIRFNDSRHQMLTEVIDLKRPEYNFLLASMPVKPNLFYKIISPTKSINLYNETLIDWYTYCKPSVDEFENTQKDIVREAELKETNLNDIDMLTNRKLNIQEELKNNSERIRTVFSETGNKGILKDLLTHIKDFTVSSKGVLELNISNELI